MVKRKSKARFGLILIMTVAVSFFVLRMNIVDINAMLLSGENFQYNVITLSATLAGFLFTGISILISTLTNERINRLWDNNYLDNLYRSASLGIIASILIIFLAFAIMWCSSLEKAKSVMIEIEFFLIMIMLVFFTWCVFRLISVIRKLKQN